MSRSTRALCLAAYLILTPVLTGPVILREVQSRPLSQIVPQSVGAMLLAANLLSVLLLVVTGATDERQAILCLPLLMAIQLWPLLLLALRPTFVISPQVRAWVVVYSALWLGAVLLAWLYFALFWSGG
jgi:hypothetical protein